MIKSGTPILTSEDHTLPGGFGSTVLEACNEARLATDLIHRHGMPEKWLYQDSRAGQLSRAGIDASGIARQVRRILDKPEAAKLDIHINVNRSKIAR